jgi:hypothetical protein
MKIAAKRTKTRLIAFLAREGAADTAPFTLPGQTILTAGNGLRHVTTDQVLHEAISDGLLKKTSGKIALTEPGKSAARRLAGLGEDAFTTQHRMLENSEIRLPGGIKQTVRVNCNESPLSRLRARAAKDGRPWISEAGFAAGEKLRQDFHFGQFQQRVTASWDPTNAAKRGKGSRGGMADISDNALDSRHRMQRALESVGPDLAGLLTDICCHLKGLETVERERRWPPRSAKLMLRTGLDLLARHYGTQAGTRS